MAQVRLFNGKPIMVGGKVALSDDCCCGGGAVGACCISGICQEDTTEADCITEGGTWQGAGTVCADVDCCEPGACCHPDNSCTVETLDDCIALGGTFAGCGTACMGVDCTCCPFFAFYDTVTFSGSISDGVHGCDFTFPEKTWTKVGIGALGPYEFHIPGGPCRFEAQDCNPSVDSSFVRLGNDTGSPCFPDAVLTADFAVTSGGRCGPFVQLAGSNTLPGCVSTGTNDFTEYDLSSGSLTVVISDSLFPSILYTFNLSVS